MAFVSTLGASDANSLLSVAEATSLLQSIPASPGVSEWLGFSDSLKEKTLVAATLIVNSMKWKGAPASSEQGLSWPRRIEIDHYYTPTDTLPLDFKTAVAYFAAFLGQDGGYTSIAVGDGGSQAKKTSDYEEVTLAQEDLKVKFRDPGIQTGSIFIPPFSMDIFMKYMVSPSFSQPRLIREPNTFISPRRYNGASNSRRMRMHNGLIYFCSY